MKMRLAFFAYVMVCLLIVAYPFSSAVAGYTQQNDVLFATHDGVPLYGDLYLPTTPGSHPAMMLIHGGGWHVGDKSVFADDWGPYLAERGYVVFSINYRLSSSTNHTWPEVLLDCKAALQYLRGNAAALGIDPDRIGVGGDSAGGQLSSMLALTQDWPAFANKYPDDAFANVSTKVKVVVPIYGVYNMVAWHMWNKNPDFDWAFAGYITWLEDLFGGTPKELPGAYLEASPIHYVHISTPSLGEVAYPNAGLSLPWFVAYGMDDWDVPAEGQSIPFINALKEAGVDVTVVAIPRVGHYWFNLSDITGRRGLSTCFIDFSDLYVICDGATPNDFIAPKLMKFLEEKL